MQLDAFKQKKGELSTFPCLFWMRKGIVGECRSSHDSCSFIFFLNRSTRLWPLGAFWTHRISACGILFTLRSETEVISWVKINRKKQLQHQLFLDWLTGIFFSVLYSCKFSTTGKVLMQFKKNKQTKKHFLFSSKEKQNTGPLPVWAGSCESESGYNQLNLSLYQPTLPCVYNTVRGQEEGFFF